MADKLDCDQYTLMVGLVNIADEYVNEDADALDLTIIKERIIRKVLNVNNYIKSLCDHYEKHNRKRNNKDDDENKKYTPNNIEKFLKRNEFFVYSASISFNPKIKTFKDLNAYGNKEGDGVCTITVKLPKESKKQSFYLKLMLKCISKNAVILKMHAEHTPNIHNILTSKVNKSSETIKIGSTSAVLKPIPKYFDEHYSDDEPLDKPKEQEVLPPVGTYSFFNQSTLLLSKYANSNIALRDEDKYVSERLLKEKNKKTQKA